MLSATEDCRAVSQDWNHTHCCCLLDCLCCWALLKLEGRDSPSSFICVCVWSFRRWRGRFELGSPVSQSSALTTKPQGCGRAVRVRDLLDFWLCREQFTAEVRFLFLKITPPPLHFLFPAALPIQLSEVSHVLESCRDAWQGHRLKDLSRQGRLIWEPRLSHICSFTPVRLL